MAFSFWLATRTRRPRPAPYVDPPRRRTSVHSAFPVRGRGLVTADGCIRHGPHRQQNTGYSPRPLLTFYTHCGAIRRRRGACLIHLCGRICAYCPPRAPHSGVSSSSVSSSTPCHAGLGGFPRVVVPRCSSRSSLSVGAPSPPPSRLSDGSCLGAPRYPLTPSLGAVRSRRAARGSVALPPPFADGSAKLQNRLGETANGIFSLCATSTVLEACHSAAKDISDAFVLHVMRSREILSKIDFTFPIGCSIPIPLLLYIFFSLLRI